MLCELCVTLDFFSRLLPVMLPGYYLVQSPKKKWQLDTFHLPGTRTSPDILLPPLPLSMDTFSRVSSFPFCLGESMETSLLHTPSARNTHASSLMAFPTARWEFAASTGNMRPVKRASAAYTVFDPLSVVRCTCFATSISHKSVSSMLRLCSHRCGLVEGRGSATIGSSASSRLP